MTNEELNKSDRGYQEIMHEHSDTVYKYQP